MSKVYFRSHEMVLIMGTVRGPGRHLGLDLDVNEYKGIKLLRRSEMHTNTTSAKHVSFFVINSMFGKSSEDFKSLSIELVIFNMIRLVMETFWKLYGS